MNKFLQFTLSAAVAFTGTALSADAASRAYGIRMYSESDTSATPKLVSFPIDDPSTVTVEADFGGYDILAATAANGIYYFLHGGEGELTPTKLVAFDMALHTFTTIAEYPPRNVAASVIPSDMTFDTDNNLIYLAGFDMTTASIVDGAASAEMGLFSIDPETGDCERIGNQDSIILTTLAYADGDMWATDSEGNLWYMDIYTGEPQDILASTGIAPYSVQSMSFAHDAQTFYWASFTAGNGGKGKSNLISFLLGEEWEIETAELGPIGDNCEIIGLYIDEEAAESAAPRGVTDLKVTPAPAGKEEAVISWTNPSMSVEGSLLKGELSIEVYRDGEKVAELSGEPAAAMTYTDMVPAPALYSYHLVAVAGALEGEPVYAAPIYVGKDAPGIPANAKAARSGDGFNISVSWEAPAIGAHEGWFDVSEVSYKVTRFPDNKVLAQNLETLSFTDSSISAQEGYSYGITAVAAGAEGPEAVSNVIVSGEPFNPPYEMDLSENGARLWTVENGDGDEYEWYVNRTIWGGTTDPFFRYYPENTLNPDGAADDWLISPYFRLESGKKYVVSYQVRLLGDLFPASTSLWIGQGTQAADMTTKLASFEMERMEIEWVTRTIPLSVENDGVYNFGYKAENRVPVQFYNFELREVVEYDIEAVALNGPAVIALGDDAEFNVEVKNHGFYEVESYTVALVDADGNTLAETTTDKAIPSGETAFVSVSWTPETEADLSVAAKVNVNGDADAENNISEPINVLVVADAKWIDFNKGTNGIGFIPMNTGAAYSASQSIYTAEMIETGGAANIKALNYSIYHYMGSLPIECEVEISMGNTERFDFADNQPVPEEEMTKVYSGKLSLSPTDKDFIFVLDTPFEYTGKNLVVYVNHKAVVNKSTISFNAYYDKSLPMQSFYSFSNTDPVDLYKKGDPAQYIANVRMLTGGATGGILLPSGEEISIAYLPASHTVTVEGDYEICNLFAADGKKIASCRRGATLNVPEGAAGIGIVEVLTGEGKVVKKIIF